ncbi:MAG TPA: S8 family serine peptidase [Chloroflexota bacterium]|nr:S8 family serine peptidase [Chloroflexota bacterium]
MSDDRPAWSSVFAPDTLHPLQRTSRLEDITPEWAFGASTGKGVRVAVIDTGIDASHSAIGKPVSGYVAVSEDASGELVYDTSPHSDPYGHGTACAGIIRSLAPECELYSVKVLGAGLLGRGLVFAAGLRWAIDNKMHVCNLSLGTSKKDFFALFHELADMAYFRQVVLVTAANNRPVLSFPSMYAAVLSVAAHDGKNPYEWYYNPTPPVEFGAPGIDVRVAWADGSWITGTGNSYAAPHITGLVARIVEAHPGLTIFQIKTILRALAANVAPEPNSMA